MSVFQPILTPIPVLGVKWPPNPPLGGGIPIRDYTPPKKCQKRTDFRTSQSSYRAKSQRSSPILMKMQNRLFSLRILKEKTRFFPKDSLGKVGVRKFWRAFLTLLTPFLALFGLIRGHFWGPIFGPFLKVDGNSKGTLDFPSTFEKGPFLDPFLKVDGNSKGTLGFPIYFWKMPLQTTPIWGGVPPPFGGFWPPKGSKSAKMTPFLALFWPLF